jgi:hypothetical protein
MRADGVLPQKHQNDAIELLRSLQICNVPNCRKHHTFRVGYFSIEPFDDPMLVRHISLIQTTRRIVCKSLMMLWVGGVEGDRTLDLRITNAIRDS